MPTRAPDKLLPPIQAFCAEVNPAVAPIFVPVEPAAGAEENECFVNVRRMVEKFGGAIQYGWGVWWWPGVFIEAEHHAIWTTPSGQLFDITPNAFGAKKTLFVCDNAAIFDEAKFRRRDNKRKALKRDPIIQEWLKCAVERAAFIERHSIGRQIRMARQEFEAVYQREADALKRVYMKYLKSNDACPCGSGRKYKKCHHGVLSEIKWSA
jgi:hypothetical protein